MAINKLNKTFTSEQVLTAEEMNQITGKIDEVITSVNTHDTSLVEATNLVDELNGEVI